VLVDTETCCERPGNIRLGAFSSSNTIDTSHEWGQPFGADMRDKFRPCPYPPECAPQVQAPLCIMFAARTLVWSVSGFPLARSDLIKQNAILSNITENHRLQARVMHHRSLCLLAHTLDSMRLYGCSSCLQRRNARSISPVKIGMVQHTWSIRVCA
jgi:hypothetical protein